MRSREEQRQPNISQESCRQREAVKLQGEPKAPSSSSAQVAPSSRKDQNDLLERMLEGDNLRLAYKRVVRNGGAPGVDGVTVAQLQAYLKTHWETVKSELLTGTYRPAPVKRVEIPKPGGGVRLLGIPTVMDRFLQQALLQVMNPIGFSFLSNKQATIRLAPKTISRFKEKIRELTNRTRPMSIEDRIWHLNRYLMGWIGFFRLASAKTHCENFDQWIRRRLRMCLWKQWKRVRTRIRELRALGVPNWATIIMANSRRGPWEMSRNTNNALPTSYWEAKGLKSLLSRYLELC